MLDDDDHRLIAQRLDLLHFDDDAPGMVSWHARGLALFRALEDAARRQVRAQGYAEVRTPQIAQRSLWEQSGHWDHFRENMYLFDDDDAVPSAVKPVSCPAHLRALSRRIISHRELPVRIAEMGLVHRREPSGALHGLFRLREFTQDDGHILCREDQAVAEVSRFVARMPGFYRAFGFERVEVALSTRPSSRAGDDAVWDRAEALLEQALVEAGLAYRVQSGAGAFYGPKVELLLHDRLGRAWQCGTIQLDMVLPERFDVAYVAADGARVRPVMLHRAMFGSVERFLGVLLEHHAGALPAWLAPEQVVVAPIEEACADAARGFAEVLERSGVRARVDGRDEMIGRRVREARALGVPWVAVIGAREVAAGQVSLRAMGEGAPPIARPIAEAVAELQGACAPP